MRKHEQKVEIVMKKTNGLNTRQIISILLLASAVIGIAVCFIVDISLNGTFTWSLYPLVSIILMCCVCLPVILKGIRGIVPSICVLTFTLIPYLYTLDVIAGSNGRIIKVGAAAASLSLAYLWVVFLIVRRHKGRLLRGFGLAMILAAPLCLMINYSLSFTLSPEAAVFDIWDVLDLIILIAGGICLVGFDYITRRIKAVEKDQI